MGRRVHAGVALLVVALSLERRRWGTDATIVGLSSGDTSGAAPPEGRPTPTVPGRPWG